MQKVTKRWISVLLTAVLLGSLLMLTPLSAAAAENETGSLNVSATSNYFPAAESCYFDFSTLEDDNGDVFVTVEYKLLAIGKYLVNIDLGELTYDPAVLEWDESYNQFGEGRNARLDLFSFAAENDLGTGVCRKTADGRIVGNFSSVNPPAWAYNEDDSAVTVVKAVFKVLDRSAGNTAVNCDIEYMALCDESADTPYPQYQVVAQSVADDTLALGETRSTVISPETQSPCVIDGIYYVKGVPTYAGLIQIDGDYYYAGGHGILFKNGTMTVYNSKSNGLLPKGDYTFDADGKIVFPEGGTGIIGGTYFENNRPKNAGVIRIGDDYYFAGTEGKLFTNGVKTIYGSTANGLLTPGDYTFGADGKIVFPEGGTGVVGDIYYENYAPKNAGLVKVGDDYYFSMKDGKLYKNGVKTVYNSKSNGLLPKGDYTFDADGKIVFPEGGTGIIGGTYFENSRPKNAGLVQVGDDYYFTVTDGRLFANGVKTIYGSTANGLLTPGEYTFGADGKIVFPEGGTGVVGDIYYENYAPKNAGLVKVGNDFYFSMKDGRIFKNGVKTFYNSNTKELLSPGEYSFGADGKIVFPENGTGIVGNIYYKNYAPKSAGVVIFEGNYYLAEGGGRIFKDGVKTIYNSNANGLLKAGEYTFDADGKIVFPENGTGIVGDIYYENRAPKNKGLVKIGDNYYFTMTGGRIFKDGVKTIYSTSANGLVAPGDYTFDADGKMVIDN